MIPPAEHANTARYFVVQDYETVGVRKIGTRWVVSDLEGGENLLTSTSEVCARAFARGVDYGYEMGVNQAVRSD